MGIVGTLKGDSFGSIVRCLPRKGSKVYLSGATSSYSASKIVICASKAYYPAQSRHVVTAINELHPASNWDDCARRWDISRVLIANETSAGSKDGLYRL
ncbi:hypothetical protein evm_014690 [Chilo suppressalis]|nr:hypothetical protein evm_014690 [Chilo suppressalis]